MPSPQRRGLSPVRLLFLTSRSPWMLTGFQTSNMQDGYWLQRSAKRIEFRVDVDPSHPVDETASTRITSEGTAGNSSAGPLNTRGRRRSLSDRLPRRVASLILTV